ncbi:MAG: M1 family metallopeptidase [Bacteroidota bacterium]
MAIRKIAAVFAGSLFSVIVFAQQPKTSQAPWQQRVDYSITVSLNDVEHTLTGMETLVYTNQSPDTLKEVYMHLWPNAYKNNETAYAKQKLENGSTDFYYSSDEDKGWIDDIAFKVDGNPISWVFTNDIDIARIILNKPVPPGTSFTLTTPFKVKIPKVFSRLGHEDQLYCITQWYPKPAVYDVNGWNPMPYLDQGEFYSEFGKFDVTITVPQNYVVAATGELQTESEKQWLTERSRVTVTNEYVKNEGFKNGGSDIPQSSSTTKTIRFTQDNVHDFAWFADKRFNITVSEAALPISRRVVKTYFYDLKHDAEKVKFIDTAVLFYSRMLGEYPYSSASVVVTPLVAGAGMEYPMITNITEVNRQVIVHEVGHNWLYGILASNEREYPWMDESINNYYETRSAEDESLKKRVSFPRGGFIVLSPEGYAGLEQRYLTGARRNEDQASGLPSVAYTDHNYGAIIYGKASTSFHYLQRYLGDSLFDAMMQAYYEKWKFKHPLPDDFKSHVKSFTGKNLDWFFDGILNTTYKQDWKISGIKRIDLGYNLRVKNKSQINGPFSVSGIQQNSVVTTIWYDSLPAQPIVFPKGEYDRICIDAFENANEIDRSNNSIRIHGLHKKCEPIQFRFVGDIENPYKTQVFYSPIAGANLYNKTMLGMAFYNSVRPIQKTTYIIAPMYAFGTQDIAGSVEIQRRFFSYGFARLITIGLKTNRYASEYFTPTTYEKIEPSLRFDLKQTHPRTDAEKAIVARYVMINEQLRGSGYYTHLDKATGYADVVFTANQKRKINPYDAQAHYQIGVSNGGFQKVDAEISQFINYNQPKKGFTVRVFGGLFLQKPRNSSTGREYYRAGGNTGLFDYLFDQSQFGRGENPGSNSMFSQQLMPGAAQFSSPTLLSGTDSWLTSINLTTTIPGIIPIKLYADAAFVNERTTQIDGNTGARSTAYNVELYYVGGFRLDLFNDVLQVNFPVVASQQITDVWQGNNGATAVPYGKRISFLFNLNKLNPVKGMRNISF